LLHPAELEDFTWIAAVARDDSDSGDEWMLDCPMDGESGGKMTKNPEWWMDSGWRMRICG
jgi:hypothetical protein